MMRRPSAPPPAAASARLGSSVNPRAGPQFGALLVRRDGEDPRSPAPRCEGDGHRHRGRIATEMRTSASGVQDEPHWLWRGKAGRRRSPPRCGTPPPWCLGMVSGPRSASKHFIGQRVVEVVRDHRPSRQAAQFPARASLELARAWPIGLPALAMRILLQPPNAVQMIKRSLENCVLARMDVDSRCMVDVDL